MIKKILTFAAMLTLLLAGTAHADLAIISHPGYAGDAPDLGGIKRLFLGERNAFPNGIKATPMHHAVGSPDRKKFFNTVLGMSESSHKRHWKRMRSTGRGNSPGELSNYQELLQWVADTPGSIAYINADQVNGNVKVLLTIEDYETL